VLILAGQGNPGSKYARNRHNAGFLVLDQIHIDHGFSPWRQKFEASVADGIIQTDAGPIKTLLVKPETFYNETGRSLAKVVKFYKLDVEDVTVIHDEIDLAPGRLRVKRGGGHSGNNGIRSMIAHLGADIRRIRVGIGHPGDKSKVMPYVLSDISGSDKDWFIPLVDAMSGALPFLAAGDDERYQTEVMRLAPAPKGDPKQKRE
jgi:PTH1 family peptidyl-tRNA hydrolase